MAEDKVSFLMESGLSATRLQSFLSSMTLDEVYSAVKGMQERGEWNPSAYEEQEDAPPEHDPNEWTAPTPFDTPYIAPFPVECLPSPLSSMVECLAESTQTPEEMAGVLSLGILSTAFQSRYKVEITSDWSEPLCLWPVAIAEPGERKSAVFSALLKPVFEYEAEVREAEAREVAQNRSERKLLESRLAAAMKPRKNVTLDDQEREVRSITAQLATFEDKYPLRLVVDDTTSEKLAELMEQQGGCITLASAEGGIFDMMAGKYDKTSNFDVFLKGHAGDSLAVDRIMRKGNYIAEPRLTMMLTVQPVILSGLMNNVALKGRGMTARFLYAVCHSKVGHRKIDAQPIPETVKEDYARFVHQILSDTGGGTIHLSPDALYLFHHFQEEIEKSLGNEWKDMRDWGSKLAGATVRIAALFHIATATSDPTETPVSQENMAAAMGIAGVLAQHAQAAYQTMGGDENTENARYILSRLKEHNANCISRTDLTHLCKGKFDKTSDMDPALDILQNRGYIRPADNEIGYNNRTQRIYFLNPAIWWN